MTRPQRFTYIDGREVVADSAVAFFEALWRQEFLPPYSLERYLDLIRNRGAVGFGIRIDVGTPEDDLTTRCKRALASLINHGWVRRRARTEAA